MTENRPDNVRFHPLHALAYALITYALIRAAGGGNDTVGALAGLIAAYGPLLPRP